MKSIGIISVPVTDQQKAKDFYLKMGLKLVNETPMGNGQTWVQLAFPDGGVDIALVNWFNKMPAGSLQGVTILCNDINATIAELSAKGINAGKPDKTPWGTFAHVADIDGNGWILHQQ